MSYCKLGILVLFCGQFFRSVIDLFCQFCHGIWGPLAIFDGTLFVCVCAGTYARACTCMRVYQCVSVDCMYLFSQIFVEVFLQQQVFNTKKTNMPKRQPIKHTTYQIHNYQIGLQPTECTNYHTTYQTQTIEHNLLNLPKKKRQTHNLPSNH